VKRSYDEERYLPWYRRPTPTWLELSIAARGVLVSVAMELNDATGTLFLRRGLSSLATMLRVSLAELEPALAELLEAGKLKWDPDSQTLSDPEYLDRKRPTSTERVRKHRSRNAGNVTSVSDPPCNGETVSSSLLFSSLSDSDLSLGSGSPSSTDPPAWWGDACELVEQNTGVTLERGPAWLRYWGHRTKSGKRIAKPDAIYWLTSVDVKELAKAREEARHREQRDKDFDAARRERKVDYTPKHEQPTREQSKAMVAALAACVQQRKAAGT